MSPEIAVSAVDWMAKKLVESGRTIFQIHFFGGEPFVAPEIIDIVVHRVRYLSEKHGLTPYFDASTNGIFNEKRCQFIGDYFGGIVLSFDGFKKYHDKNRPAFKGKPTFELVAKTAKRLSEMPLDLCLRVCITQDSVEEMEAITRWMATTFKPAVINFEPLTPGGLAMKAGLKTPDPYLFGINCLKAYQAGKELGIKVVYSAAETNQNRISFCPVGTDALIVALDGRASACYLLEEDWKIRDLDMNLGWVKPEGTVDIDFDALYRIRSLPTKKPRCQSCFCQWSCAGGCHVNETYPGATQAYNDFCIQTRITTAGLLLQELGDDQLVKEFLNDQQALEAVANHISDVVDIKPFKANNDIEPSSTKKITEKNNKANSLISRGIGLLG